MVRKGKMILYLLILFVNSNTQNAIDLIKLPYRIVRITEN